MKKYLLLLVFLPFVFACNDRDVGGGSGINPGDLPLITGNTSQENVSYRNNVAPLTFEQVNQVGDSTFFEAGIDFNENNANDLLFQLVRWGDEQVLTVRARDGFEIPFSGSDFEIISISQMIPGINLLGEGIELNNIITDYASLTDGFLTNTSGNRVNTSANMLIWNGIAYLPFRGNNRIGWIGLRINNGAGVQIDGLNISTIAIRTL